MNIAFILSVGIFLSIITYIAFNLDSQHMALKFFLIFMVLFSFPVMTKGFLQDCDYVVSSEYETYIYGDNFTDYHWDYESPPNPNTLKDIYLFHKTKNLTYEYQCTPIAQEGEISTFIKITTWLTRFFSIYILIYLSYTIFNKLKTNQNVKQ